jgi:hypothetical protein
VKGLLVNYPKTGRPFLERSTILGLLVANSPGETCFLIDHSKKGGPPKHAG